MTTGTSRQKIIAASCLMLALLVGFGPVIPENVPPAHALLGAGDTAFEINPAVIGGIGATAAATGITAGASTVTAANSSIQTVTTQVLNGIAWAVAKTVIQSITKSMVNWINSGFQGNTVEYLRSYGLN